MRASCNLRVPVRRHVFHTCTAICQAFSASILFSLSLPSPCLSVSPPLFGFSSRSVGGMDVIHLNWVRERAKKNGKGGVGIFIAPKLGKCNVAGVSCLVEGILAVTDSRQFLGEGLPQCNASKKRKRDRIFEKYYSEFVLNDCRQAFIFQNFVIAPSPRSPRRVDPTGYRSFPHVRIDHRRQQAADG
jgi:hypothetical protein